MARAKGEKIYHICVVGMSGTETDRGVTGVGKSCLCNRFMRPHADDYFTDHISVISAMDFSGRIVNNDHFLYWGEVTKKFDNEQMTFRVVEQTEFIDDSSFSPLRGSNTHSYFKRAAVTKLQSAEKVMYICKDQVGDETNFPQKILPDGKFSVDGFIIIYDVSKSSGHEKQNEWLTKLINHLNRAKRPIVVAATKFDEPMDSYVREARNFASKNKLTLIETSAQECVNVEQAFVTLAYKIDKRGTPREQTYNYANEQRQKALNSAVTEYLELLKREVTNYRELWSTKKRQFQNDPAFQKVVEIAGTKHARQNFTRHTHRLRQEHQQEKKKKYLDHLPDALDSIFPDLNSIGGRDWTETRQILPEMDKFEEWFIMLPEGVSWKESEHIDTSDEHIPYDILEDNETECENLFGAHVNRLNAAKRKEKMKEEFKKLLESLPNIVLPSRLIEDEAVMDTISEHECFKELDEGTRVAIYNVHQEDIQKRALADLQELLMERYSLLANVDITSSPRTEVNRIIKTLEKEPRYQRLSEMDILRVTSLIQELIFIQNPSTDSCYYRDRCMDKLIQSSIEKAVQNVSDRSPIRDTLGSLDDTNSKLSMIVMGEDSLADELEAEINSQSYDGDYTLNKVLYSLELRTIEGDIMHPTNQLVTDNFTPKGCICVFTSLEGFKYVKNCLELTILSGEEEYNIPALRDLAVVLMFGRSTSPEADTAQVREQAERLCSRLNNCQIVNVPQDSTTMWPGKKFSESQIQEAIRSVVAGQKYSGGSLNQTESALGDKGEGGFRIGLSMMCGDPYQPDLVLSPVTSNQCMATPNRENSLSCHMFLVDTKCRVEFEVASYHRSGRLREERVHHGYILVYYAQRKASREVLRWYLKQSEPIPTLVVAVCEDINSAAEGITEINRLVDETETAKLVTANCSTFRDQTVIYNKFLKDAFDKRRETEKAYKLADPEPPSPGDRLPMSLPSPSQDGAFDPAQTPTTGFTPEFVPRNRSVSSEAVVHDSLVKPSEVRNRVRLQQSHFSSRGSDDVYEDIPTQFSTPGRRNSARTSSEGTRIYHTPHYDSRPRRWGSELRRKPNSALPPTPLSSGSEGIYATVGKEHMTSTPGPKSPAEPSGMMENVLYVPFQGPDQGLMSSPAQDDYGSQEGSRHGSLACQDDSMGELEVNPMYAPWVSPAPLDKPIMPPPTAPKPAAPGFQKVKPSVPTTPRPPLSSVNSSITSDSGQDTPSGPNVSRQSNQSGMGGQLNQSKLKSQRDVFVEGLEKLKEQYSMDGQGQDPDVDTIGKLQKKKEKDKKKGPKQPKHKKKGPMAPPKKPAKQLEQLILNENGIPPFIEQCVGRLEEEGISQEGIYRVSGKAADIDLIIKMFEENENASLSTMENLSANTIAAALKQFFKNLPEPIIPYSTQDRMIQDYKELNCEEAFVERLPEYLSGLGNVRRTVLTYMMKHMRRITDHSEVNLMTAENLSICWWPSMLHPQSTSFEDLANEQLLAVVFKQIVENAPHLFNFT